MVRAATIVELLVADNPRVDDASFAILLELKDDESPSVSHNEVQSVFKPKRSAK